MIKRLFKKFFIIISRFLDFEIIDQNQFTSPTLDKSLTENLSTINKKQLMSKIATTLNQSKADAERTFDSILNLILDCLKNDEQVKIAGFGTYKVAKRKARIGRNPRTGEQIQIAASQKVKFLPAKALKEMFNK